MTNEMTNDEIRALLAELEHLTPEHGMKSVMHYLERQKHAIEALLAREAEVLEYALNNNMMLGSSSLLADLTAILNPQPAAMAREKT